MQLPQGSSKAGATASRGLCDVDLVRDHASCWEQCQAKECPVQELETVVADRNSLQRQLTSVAAAHEAETRQLHADKTALKVGRGICPDV